MKKAKKKNARKRTAAKAKPIGPKLKGRAFQLMRRGKKLFAKVW